MTFQIRHLLIQLIQPSNILRAVLDGVDLGVIEILLEVLHVVVAIDGRTTGHKLLLSRALAMVAAVANLRQRVSVELVDIVVVARNRVAGRRIEALDRWAELLTDHDIHGSVKGMRALTVVVARVGIGGYLAVSAASNRGPRLVDHELGGAVECVGSLPIVVTRIRIGRHLAVGAARNGRPGLDDLDKGRSVKSVRTLAIVVTGIRIARDLAWLATGDGRPADSDTLGQSQESGNILHY